MARKAVWTKLFGTAVVVSIASAGCVVKQDDADRFREAVPQSDDVALKVPGGQAAGGTKAKGLHFTTNGAAPGSARYYRFTRDLTGAVDFGTAVILGGIWLIVHSEPTTIDAKHAVWGPGQGNALDPVVWRFTVTEVGNQEYDYALEGRPKAGGDGDFLAVLKGHGYGKSRAEHRTGWFLADNEAFRKLDPDHGHDTGTTKVTFDLTRLPAAIKVELRPGGDKGWSDVTVAHESGGAGSVEITGQSDIDDSKATKLEDIHVLSRWTTAGSGRADLQMKNGDLPRQVDASECWSESFARVFYKDSIDYEPAYGDAAACALPAAKL